MESNICQEKMSNYHLNLDVLAPMSLCYYPLFIEGRS
jgi:hypothetical protein